MFASTACLKCSWMKATGGTGFSVPAVNCMSRRSSIGWRKPSLPKNVTRIVIYGENIQEKEESQDSETSSNCPSIDGVTMSREFRSERYRYRVAVPRE